MEQKFVTGDVVRSRYGNKTAVVAYSIWDGRFYCRYQNGRGGFYAETRNLVKVSETKDDSTPMENTKTLFSFTKEDGTTGYGTHIGTNSQNQYLIEEKGTGQILVYAKDKLEEVLPYTFCASIAGKETHYLGKPDTLKKGDVLLYTGSSSPQIAVVTAVDTKCKTARAKFKGAKLVTESF